MVTARASFATVLEPYCGAASPAAALPMDLPKQSALRQVADGRRAGPEAEQETARWAFEQLRRRFRFQPASSLEVDLIYLLKEPRCV